MFAFLETGLTLFRRIKI